MGYPKEEMSSHGFRSMTSILLYEQGWNHQLAHSERNALSAAQLRRAFAVAAKTMQALADYLDGLKADAEVIPQFKKA